MEEGYAPGFGADAIAMLSARDAADRAGFLIDSLDGSRNYRIVDLGCGPGAMTVGLGQALPTSQVLGIDSDRSQVTDALQAAQQLGITNVDFRAASAYDLPLAEHTVDVVFAHALFGHLSEPKLALAEAMRILRPGGTLAVSTSDWSRAKFRPKTVNVDAAMRGHYILRQRAGGDPFAGRRIADHVQHAGFTAVTSKVAHRADLGYTELANYVETRLAAALAEPDGHDLQLASAARSAAAWAGSGRGDVKQCWVEVLAIAPA
ncbi:class I SAM-dependent methyltransferase [Antrihabitans cavernicola]|uniref:Class I SAM-dependent methyltransferase n=1 Tax=Antrihabitans cavernicola TaxID=2495913 RepID=A0A5A7S8F2_9NOCA|nr:class I SAM-dependent methyltransferase [Spelaeibacter cavernicola]KAA0018454.1 class I SAM-dependent methyltransferase [Spelaeibacter cavernicola]